MASILYVLFSPHQMTLCFAFRNLRSGFDNCGLFYLLNMQYFNTNANWGFTL